MIDTLPPAAPLRHARSGASGSPSPTAATCAAATACRRRTTSGCLAPRSSPSRRSTAWPGSSPASACTRSASPAASRCCDTICPSWCVCCAATRRLDDLALTTNGILLARQAAALRAAGLGRVTVSLDTLRPERMLAFARSAAPRGHSGGNRGRPRRRLRGVKLNSVVIRGYNDDELIDLVEFGRARGVEVRFIEYMDVGGATAVVDGPGGEPAGDSRHDWRSATARSSRAAPRPIGRRPSDSVCRMAPRSA